jgi:hypothetical protein
MDTQGIRVQDLLNYLPNSLLDQLAVETQVDYQVKKLSGKLVFTLLLYATLHTTRMSLNVLIAVLESAAFRAFSRIPAQLTTRRNSLADRLATIQVSYFERLFKAASALCRRRFPLDKKLPYRINRFDSTVVSCSAKLLSMGMVSGAKPGKGSPRVRQLKFSIGFDGLSVSDCRLYTQQRYLSEDRALAEIIEGSSACGKEIIVFDRGISDRKTFRQFSQQQRLFVTRLKPDARYEVVARFTDSSHRTTPTLELLSDQMVYLHGSGGRVLQFPFRLIRAASLVSGERLLFLTNIFDLKAAEITQIYRLRWEIELFIRFLKQEMNFSHLLCRNQNGIMVSVYVTLIAMLLLLLYRKLNQLRGMKIVKLKFANELQTQIIKEIVLLCNGNPQLVDQFNPSG